jgi:dTDP-4-dehydrorhamnose 3,5-epimerase
MFWIPKGFAHGFYTLSESADVAYKVTDFYAPQHEETRLWNETSHCHRMAIARRADSFRDRAGISLKEAASLSK